MICLKQSLVTIRKLSIVLFCACDGRYITITLVEAHAIARYVDTSSRSCGRLSHHVPAREIGRAAVMYCSFKTRRDETSA